MKQEKAKIYSGLKYGLSASGVVYLLLLLFLFMGLGGSKALVQSLLRLSGKDYLVVPVYIAIVCLGYYILSLPLNFYQSFILERQFGLSRQRVLSWFNDQLKAGAIFYLIMLILAAAFYYFLKRFTYHWWLAVSLFWIILSVVLAKIAPLVIIPLFFKSTKISDSGLRQRIMDLAKKMQIRILDVFQIDFSKKTLKANAALVGWGATRRVLLADTLKDKYAPDEIEVILAHEFAHHKLRHMHKLILINALATLVSFYLIFMTGDKFLNLFNLSSLWDIAALPVVLIYFVILGIILAPLENFFSRRFESAADKLALEASGLKEAFISMMEKLSSQNLADRNPHPLIKIFFFDHPPIDERIALARSFK